ncbi:MAG: cysteine desulfurase [Clostridia bacterium]|nr:cysteine desulfurase [Clostridia bacterium]
MIYLDNAATTRPNENAVRRAGIFLTERYFNPSALYGGGFAVNGELAAGKKFLLSRIADPIDYDITITSCGTEADNHALFCCGKRGNIVTTEGEHAAVFACAQELKNRGIEVRFARLKEDGSVDEEHLLSLIDEKTSLVSVIHVNNETGAINRIAELSKRVKAKNPRAVFHSDGVQAYGKIPVKLNKEIDLYAVSAHKIGGLKGTGALIRKKSLPLAPYIFGGGQENGKRSGTENVFGIMTFYYAAEEKFARLKEEQKEVERLREEVWGALDRTLFTRLSPQDGTPYILTVSAEGLRGEVLQRMLYDNGLAVGTGSACSSKHRYSRVMTACGYGERVLDGVLRLSFSPQNTREEGLRAAKILNETANKLKEKTAD